MRSHAITAFVLALALIFLPGAFVYCQTQSTSITIVGIVPEILKLTLDFASDTNIQLIGHLSTGDEQQAAYLDVAQYASYTGQNAQNCRNFDIVSGSTIALGKATIFSNIRGMYTVSIYSTNKGKLQNSSNVGAASIEYGLAFGNAFAMSQDGVFRFSQKGVSSRGGRPLAVALVLGDIPATAADGIYSDQLYFSICKN